MRVCRDQTAISLSPEATSRRAIDFWALLVVWKIENDIKFFSLFYSLPIVLRVRLLCPPHARALERHVSEVDLVSFYCKTADRCRIIILQTCRFTVVSEHNL